MLKGFDQKAKYGFCMDRTTDAHCNLQRDLSALHSRLRSSMNRLSTLPPHPIKLILSRQYIVQKLTHSKNHWPERYLLF